MSASKFARSTRLLRLDIYNASSLKQWSSSRHIAQLGHIAFTQLCCMLNGEAATSIVCLRLDQTVARMLETTIYCTRR